MTTARMDGRVPHDWIVDRSRRVYHGGRGYTGLRAFAEGLEQQCQGYSRDWWQDQPKYVEVIVEKDAIIGALTDTCSKLGVDVRPLRGFCSLTVVQAIAKELADQITDGKEPVLFYLGDHDPSGRDIERDLLFRLRSCPQSEGKLRKLRLERLAIFKADIRKFRLPPLRVKLDDPRSGRFLRKHGASAVELDALPPAELRRRVRTAIEGEINQRTRERSQRVEQAEMETSRRIGAELRLVLGAVDS